ncbi:VOC family protein [Streptomyces sp. NPDC050355]|uniref:VOC family protein n=1 Tax=Streptomyces sp. NPDC050355 TaxID=3365609 RepID=UPI00378CD942
MDALYPRLLVTRFAECFRFYEAILPPLAGARLVKGTPDGPYANWDVDDDAVLVLFDRGAMAATIGTGTLPAPPRPAQDAAMLVFRVDDVDKRLAFCLEHGGRLVAGPTDRPEWGPNLRSAHLRDPDGHLIELQSY